MLLDKLKQLMSGEKSEAGPHIFNEKQVEKLLAVIAFMEKLDALRFFGKYLMWLVVALGTLIVNWERIKTFLMTNTGG